MAKQKVYDGSDWTVVGTDAEKVDVTDANNNYTNSDVEGVLDEIASNITNRIIVNATQPITQKTGDLWFQIV